MLKVDTKDLQLQVSEYIDPWTNGDCWNGCCSWTWTTGNGGCTSGCCGGGEPIEN